jgi:hypothetical protein
MVKLFGILENVFYISLGITFALILLLVYHFKQRLSAAEKKSDTMYEIITNVVQELNVMKSQLHGLHMQNQPKPEIQIIPAASNQVVNLYNSVATEDDDTESDRDESESSEDESDDEYDYEDDVSIIKYELIEVRTPEDESTEYDVGLDTSTIDVVLESPEYDVVLDAPTIDVVLDAPTIDVVLEAPTIDVVLEAPTIDVVLEAPTIDVVLEAPTIDVVLDEEIKSEFDELKDVSVIGQDYKKMNLNHLRSLAAVKFPDIDTGKMKKAEVIKLISE